MNPTNRYPHIFRPLNVGATTLRHRIMVTGHTQLYGENGTVSERHIDYYRERAKGGAALLILEQQAAHPAGRNYHAGCGAWDTSVVPGYKRLAEAVHEHECKILAQLFCAGAQGDSTQYFDDWRPLWAASRIPSAVTEEMPVAMDQANIDELVQYFARCADNVRQAGLDGIEVHAAHSQLLGEFLSPAFNKRKDQYGGSIENRCRIILEIGSAIRDVIGPYVLLGLRLSFDEYLGPIGITPEQSEQQIEIFSASGLFDFFDISGGGYHNLHVAVAPMGTVPEGFLVDCARRAKKVTGDRAKIFVVGRFLDLSKAEEVLSAGDADMVAMTRAHMSDPFIVAKSAEGREDEVTRCVGANVCVSRLISNREVTCMQNPAMGREKLWGVGTLDTLPAEQQRDISIVGGGPAGLRFAATAASRGHHVRVFEARAELGGRMYELASLPTREGWQTAIDNLVRPLNRLGVEPNCKAPIEADNIDGDIIVCATGSSWDRSGYSPYRPERLEIPGANLPFVLDLGQAIKRAVKDQSALGRHVLIVDETGEYHPLGLAELLSANGVEVEIVTPRPFIGAETQRTLDLPHIMPRLKAAGVKITAQHFIELIEDRVAIVYDIWGGEPYPINDIDTIVLGMTRSPDDALYRQLVAEGRTALKIGDVISPRPIEAIIYEAEKFARSI